MTHESSNSGEMNETYENLFNFDSLLLRARGRQLYLPLKILQLGNPCNFSFLDIYDR